MSNNFDILEALWLRRERKRRAQKIIEGALPLTYTAKKAGTLTDYRIYGQTENGESVGDLETTGEHAGEYKVPVTVSNGTDTLTTPIYLPEQIRKVGDEAEYIDYAEQKQHRVRKNLLPNTAASQTINGVTFTVNGDGSVTCNGTATQVAAYTLNDTFSLEPGTYKLTGCPAGGEHIDKYKLDIVMPPTSYGTDIGNGSSFTLSSTLTNALYRIVIYNNQVCNNLTFYPMIRKAGTVDDTYEPYIENTELDVTLPALPTIAGTNTISVGTQVQPSKVMVRGKLKE